MKKLFKYFVIIILILIFLVVITLSIIRFVSKEDREIAMNFAILSSKGSFEEASELMHDALKKEFTIESFKSAFTNSKAYIDASFSSINLENGVTTLKGIAKTEDDCTSTLYFEILDSKIIRFNITPLCLK